MIPAVHLWWRLPATLCLLWAGCLATPAHAQRWKFVVFGDTIGLDNPTQINTNILGELAQAIAGVQPDLVLFAGDFATYPSLERYQLWTNIFAPVLNAGIPVYPTLGNHDIDDPASFTNVFGSLLPTNGPPGEPGTYAVTHANGLFLLLSEFVPGREYRVNQGFVDAVLATNTQPHVFALGHVPAFKLYHSGTLGDYPDARSQLWNGLSNAHARFYFCGHDHFYDRTRLDDGDGNPENDLQQVIVGTGGAIQYPDGIFDGTNGIWAPVRRYHTNGFGFVSVEIEEMMGRGIWYRRNDAGAYEPTDEVFAWSLGPRPQLEWGVKSGHLVVSWSGPGRLEEGLSVDGPFREIVGAQSPYMVRYMMSTPHFYRLNCP